MAFDRTNPADLIALKAEYDNDPLSMGYAAVSKSTQQLLSLFNDPDNNLGNDTVGETFTPNLILSVIEPTDLNISGQFTSGKLEWIKLLMESAANEFTNLDEHRTKFKAQFQANTQTVANLDARVTRISRAEVLFGVGTVISRDDWFAARDYVA